MNPVPYLMDRQGWPAASSLGRGEFDPRLVGVSLTIDTGSYDVLARLRG